MDKKKFKLNNAGMTLVECIVAVTILSIAMIPLLTSFSYSIRYSAKAKMKQRSTNVAQEMLENFKAESLTDIKSELTTGKDATGELDPESGDVKNYDVFTNVKYTDADLSGVLANGSGTYKFSNVSAGESSTPFNVVVDVKPATSTVPMFNGIEDSAVDVMDSDHLDKMLADLKSKLDAITSSPNVKIRDVYISRKITISISGGQASVSYDYDFKARYGTYDPNVINPTWHQPDDLTYASIGTYSVTEHTPVSLGTDNGFVYFYYPIYHEDLSVTTKAFENNASTGSWTPRDNWALNIAVLGDEIYLANNDIDGLKLYLFKEKRYDGMDAAKIYDYTNFDRQYILNFAKISYDNTNTGFRNFKLYTNINQNLYTGTNDANIDYIQPGNSAGKRSVLSTMSEGNDKNLIYDISIKVYTINPIPGYPAGSLVSSINGTVLDENKP